MIPTEQDLTVDGDAIVLRQLMSADKTAIVDVIQALAQQQPMLAGVAAMVSLELDTVLSDPSSLAIGAFENGTLTTVLMIRLCNVVDFQGDLPGVIGHWERPGVKALTNGFSRNGTLLRDFLYSTFARSGMALYWQQSTISTTVAQTTEGDWSTNDQLQANKTWKQVYVETVATGSSPNEPWIKQNVIEGPCPVPVTIRKMKPVN